MRVEELCYHCRTSLTGGLIPTYYKVAQPFVICPRCGAANDISSNATEWELMGPCRRARILGLSAYTSLGAGFFGSILLSLIADGFVYGSFGPDGDRTTLNDYWPLIAALGFGAALVWRFLVLHRQIQASRDRMRDPAYRATLDELGLSAVGD